MTRKAILALGLLVLTGCSSAAVTHTAEPSAKTLIAADQRTIHPLTTTPKPVLPVVVHNDDGSTVTVRDVSRIIPLTGSLSEVVFSLNLGSHVVARDVATTFTVAAKLPVITRAHEVSAESVLALRPTVVIADTDTGPPESIEQIRAAGVPVVVLPVVDSVGGVATRIHAVADALGVRAAGNALVSRTAAEIAAAENHVTTQAKPLRVAFLYLRGTAGVYLIGGKGSGADSLIKAAGGVDVGSALGLKAFTPITSEALVTAQPDVLLLMTDGLQSVGGIDGLAKIPGVAQTPAGENRRVVTIEDGVLLNFGPRTAEVITALADALTEYR